MEQNRKLTRKEKIAQGIEKEKGSRKSRAAEVRKQAKKDEFVVTLKNFRSSARKVRMLADLIRNNSVEHAVNVLSLSTRKAALPLKKLLLSAVDSYQQKRGESALDLESLYIKKIKVDGARYLRRIQPAPQGRAHLIRKRFCHVTVEVAEFNED